MTLTARAPRRWAPAAATPRAARRSRASRGDDRGSILYFVLFPNALVSLHPDYVMLHTLYPRAPGRTDVVCEWFFEPARSRRRTSTLATRSSSGTRPTARTGTSASWPRRGCGSRGYTAGRYSARGDRHPRVRLDGRRALHGGARDRGRGAGVNAGRRAGSARSGLPEPVPSSPQRDWDAIVVGGGHNGLTAAAYLARAGQVGAGAGAPRAPRRRLHARAPLRGQPLRRQPLRLRRRAARRAS